MVTVHLKMVKLVHGDLKKCQKKVLNFYLQQAIAFIQKYFIILFKAE